jgi:hypothetical protein
MHRGEFQKFEGALRCPCRAGSGSTRMILLHGLHQLWRQHQELHGSRSSLAPRHLGLGEPERRNLRRIASGGLTVLPCSDRIHRRNRRLLLAHFLLCVKTLRQYMDIERLNGGTYWLRNKTFPKFFGVNSIIVDILFIQSSVADVMCFKKRSNRAR